eukprot:CAMPEP_0202901862 /NCGR_PEP_ID=MMETSP1392-20130828/15064_1 /ASSEMBLY_ACC=CAM_ASM_000868 /TAXON_ID=225041 /ORGANISM="Chlamydomonas chlamydogama, Strain SAG 11-48b" /LENGTH=39 /DNA_ID= /DNA_START= /DNA_END= /DNA_ORIENTATION=
MPHRLHVARLHGGLQGSGFGPMVNPKPYMLSGCTMGFRV